MYPLRYCQLNLLNIFYVENSTIVCHLAFYFVSAFFCKNSKNCLVQHFSKSYHFMGIKFSREKRKVALRLGRYLSLTQVTLMWSGVGIEADANPRNTRLNSSGLLISFAWIFIFKTWTASGVPTKESASIQNFL